MLTLIFEAGVYPDSECISLVYSWEYWYQFYIMIIKIIYNMYVILIERYDSVYY